MSETLIIKHYCSLDLQVWGDDKRGASKVGSVPRLFQGTVDNISSTIPNTGPINVLVLWI